MLDLSSLSATDWNVKPKGISLTRILQTVYLIQSFIGFATSKTVQYTTSAIEDPPYLTARYNPDTLFEGNDSSVIEFWPGYEPLPNWLIVADNKNVNNVSLCDYDFEIGLIPYTMRRFADIRRMRKIPALKLMDFYRRDLSYLFDPTRGAPKSEAYYNTLSCRFDTIYLDPPYRFYGFIGSRQMVYDARWDTVYVGHAPVPFARHIDTIYRDPHPNRTHLKVYISQNWFYIFNMYTETFHMQGYLYYLWSSFRSATASYGIDSVLVAPNNQSICRFVHNLFQCGDDQPEFYPLEWVFENGQEIITPIRASFNVPFTPRLRNGVALLDSQDVIWMYEYNAQQDRYLFLFKTHVCDYLLFGRLPCCWAIHSTPKGSQVPSFEEELGSGDSFENETQTDLPVPFEEELGSGDLFQSNNNNETQTDLPVPFEEELGSGVSILTR